MSTLFSIDLHSPLPLLRCSLLTCPHGFATRLGGVSRGYLSSLNVGESVGDSPSFVAENRARLLRAVGATTASPISAHQIHSDRVIAVDDSDVGKDFSCDGFVTKAVGLPLMVKTADCVPLLLQDAENGVIGAVHAGWRGTVSQIARNAVLAMCDIGAEVNSIRVAVGPCIHPCCYTVGEEVIRAVNGINSINPDAVLLRNGNTVSLDLPELNRQILLASGVAPDHIALSEYCTCCHGDKTLFFSHRASGGKRGVMGSVIML